VDDPVFLVEVAARSRNPTQPITEETQPSRRDGAAAQREREGKPRALDDAIDAIREQAKHAARLAIQLHPG